MVVGGPITSWVGAAGGFGIPWKVSFLPWLLGTALPLRPLFENGYTKKLGILPRAAFGASLLGTFLVRSGVLTSVHTFATDPERRFILLLFLVVLGGVYCSMHSRSIVEGWVCLPQSTGKVLWYSIKQTIPSFAWSFDTLYPLLLDAFDAGRYQWEHHFQCYLCYTVHFLIACPIRQMAWKAVT